MFGREFSKTPSILLSSFGQMHDSYKKNAKKSKNKNQMLQKIYLKLFGIPEIGFQLRSLYFKDLVVSNLSNKKLNTILDAGSGIGIYSFWLAKKYPDAKIVGGEIDKEKLDFSSSFSKELNLQNTAFEYLDVTNVTSKKKYDFVVNIDVLEHIEDFRKVLKNFYKLLNKGGYLFIHTPQPHQQRIFKGLKKWAHEDHVHEGYTPEELKSELKKLGFKIVSAKETFGLFGKIAWELNHMSFQKGFIVSGLLYPILYVLASLDLLAQNSKGLGTAILAKKVA